MGKKNNNLPPEETRLLKSLPEAEERLAARIKEGEALEAEQINSEAQLKEAEERYYAWSSYNSTLLKKLFSGNEAQREYSGPGFQFMSLGATSFTQDLREHFDSVHKKVRALRTIKSKLELYE